MATTDWAHPARLLLYHSQKISARTLFLRHGTGSVLAPAPLPFLSTTLDEDEDADSGDAAVFVHPAALISEYCASIGVPASMLEVQGEFHAKVETPSGIADIYLVRCTSLDPPRALFAPLGAQFCPITELRGGHPAEMALLQRAYETILG